MVPLTSQSRQRVIDPCLSRRSLSPRLISVVGRGYNNHISRINKERNIYLQKKGSEYERYYGIHCKHSDFPIFRRKQSSTNWYWLYHRVAALIWELIK